jgi:hypothetical protein
MIASVNAFKVYYKPDEIAQSLRIHNYNRSKWENDDGNIIDQQTLLAMDEALVEGWRLKPIHIRVTRKWGYSDAYLNSCKAKLGDKNTKEAEKVKYREALVSGTVSEITIDGFDFKADALEEKGPCTIEDGLDRRIPADTYSLRWRYETTMTHHNGTVRVFKLTNKKPSGILIHTGTTLKHTTGCLIVGEKTYNKDGTVKTGVNQEETVLVKNKELFQKLIDLITENGVYEMKKHATDGFIFNAQLIISEEFTQ